MSAITERLRGAVARGWTTEKNSNKIMDVDLAIAITEMVEDEVREIQREKERSDNQWWLS